MNRAVRLSVLGLVAVTALGTSTACSKKKTTAAPTAAPSSTTPAPNPGSSSPAGPANLGLGLADDNKFTPDTLTASAGQVVKLTLKNVGATIHNFELKNAGIPKDGSTDVTGGQIKNITFTAPAPGTYTFDCKYHVALGMKGTLTVT